MSLATLSVVGDKRTERHVEALATIEESELDDAGRSHDLGAF